MEYEILTATNDPAPSALAISREGVELGGG